ncbi:HAD family hydrolase [uncultured Nocardioides sp.]|uniref:HAD family hydrolase n=1 Tax=uncultured Nocardioides sp. TaxID=198441 RepID=UPI00261AB462|nr:HAD family hydrolase [uncultured Nocardioides sp.]
MDDLRLPSWRPGPTRDSVIGFLDAAPELPAAERLACFDNDGTLWVERPTYVQWDFFVDALTTRSAEDASLAREPELAAVLGGDRAAIAELGLVRIAMALNGLFAGITPEAFTSAAREFMSRAEHPTLGRRHASTTYQPMLELIAELRALDFAVTISTGGGAEFVRAVSQDLYGIPPESVVGTLVQYEYTPDDLGRPRLLRTRGVVGDANEGATKVTNIQTQLGRRPCLAAGNSAGDREMLDWALTGDGPSLALLLDHDDHEREVAYTSEAGTFDAVEPILEVAERSDWTVVSMRRDWETVFAPDPA